MLLALITFGLALLSLAQAAPVQAATNACQSVAPARLAVLRQNDPDRPSDSTNVFHLERGGPPYANTVITAMTFNIPAGSTGCQLRVRFPPNSNVAYGIQNADVWSTARWEPANPPTWNRQPSKAEHVAQVQFPSGQPDPVNTIIASNSCQTTMSYLFAAAEWQYAAGTVYFTNDVTGAVPVGFDMVYNC